ncbi:hypothetical protein [uncultured Mucilaginibacter sp.]|uniref:hypothetical protein n=1 Tax=uncultured Mucilaginibacter sp. TaxID=797541 RepID=UPI0025FF39FC|nr:hypothetical protein [uncultured Mucilaginibacter sp.]
MKLALYYRYFIVFNILLAIPPIVAQVFFAHRDLLIPYFWQFFGLFAIVNLVIHLLNHLGIISSGTGLVKTFLGGTMLKFLLWMIVIFIYTSEIDVNGGNFLINFFYLYLFNSVFEIYCLLINLRNQN